MSQFPNMQVTQLLAAARRGEGEASQQLLPLVYDELRKLAAARMAGEKPGQTLQATALVHEAYLRLVGSEGSGGGGWQTRGHFFAAAAEAMRRILVERARSKASGKHGGAVQRVALTDIPDFIEPPPDEMLALDHALERLGNTDPRARDIVMLRYFAGLTVEQTAEAMEISTPTVKREWSYARAWLFDAISTSLSESESGPRP